MSIIGKQRQAMYFKKYNIASHHKNDYICKGCNGKHIDSLDIDQEHIVDGTINRKRLFGNLLDLTTSLVHPSTTRINIYNLNEYGYETLINLSPYQLDQIVTTTLSVMNKQNINVKETITALYSKPVGDYSNNFIVYGSTESNYSPSTVNMVKSMMFEFFHKCRASSSFKMQGVQHRFAERTIRRYFHSSLYLLDKFFKTNYFGFGHISHDQIRSQETIFLRTINSILKIPITIFADGFSHDMTKYIHFASSYNNFSPKSNSEVRNSQMFTTYDMCT